jgi:hypothetical protein
MRTPRTPSRAARHLLEPRRWRHGRARGLLISLVLLSAWFPAPHPVPTLMLMFVWLAFAVPQFLRRARRRRIIRLYFLPPAADHIDDADVRRMRARFAIAFLLVVFQLPFFAAYAVSYPFLVRSAWYWWSEAPFTQNPPAHPTVRGVFLVTHMTAEPRTTTFYLPGGYISFGVSEDDGSRMKGEFHAVWPNGEF